MLRFSRRSAADKNEHERDLALGVDTWPFHSPLESAGSLVSCRCRGGDPLVSPCNRKLQRNTVSCAAACSANRQKR
jgi:hypothetical protein